MPRGRVVVLSLVAGVLVVVLVACNTAPATGSMTVTVNGLPAGLSAAVTVTGPGGYAQAVTGTATLTGLAPGTYSLTVGRAATTDTIVPTLYDGTAAPSSVTLTANGTASTAVDYAVRPGSGHLWVPLAGGSLEAEAYPSGSLVASGAPGQDVTLAAPTSEGESVAFDGAGNMWVGDCSGRAYRYSTAQLASSGSPAPSVTIDATSHGCVAGLAFDASGDLWATISTASQVLEFTPAQLASGGAVPPAVTIGSDSASSLAGPIGLAFNAAGDLWVANLSRSTLVEFTPAQLAVGGLPTPAVTIAADATPSLSSPAGMAFDPAGNLWVSNAVTNTVVRYDAAQLATSGSPTPAATIASGSFASGATTVGLAFDASGALWVASKGSHDLRRFTDPGALSGSVTPAAATVITGVPSSDVTMLAFSPPPPAVPIQAP